MSYLDADRAPPAPPPATDPGVLSVGQWHIQFVSAKSEVYNRGTRLMAYLAVM